MKRFFTGPALLLAALAMLITAQTALALDVPKLTGRVNDEAGMLSPQARQRLDQELSQFEKSDSTQVVVLTIPSLEGDNLEDYSIRVAQAWGLGQKGKDNGVLFLISKGDRKMRIEVGWGLEGRLTDALTGRILDNVVTPRFRAGNFDAGVEDGVKAIIEGARGEYKGDRERSRKTDDPGLFIIPIVIGIFLMAVLRALPKAVRAAIGAILLPLLGFFFSATLVVILLLIPAGLILGLIAPALFRSGGRGGGMFYGGGGGGFSSGGGFSGGGGSFGGGGSSGGW